MSAFKLIRTRLKLSQAEAADLLGVSQGNVSHYEARGQTVPPRVAKRLIEVAAERGHTVTYDDIYAEPDVAGLPQEARHAA